METSPVRQELLDALRALHVSRTADGRRIEDVSVFMLYNTLIEARCAIAERMGG